MINYNMFTDNINKFFVNSLCREESILKKIYYYIVIIFGIIIILFLTGINGYNIIIETASNFTYRNINGTRMCIDKSRESIFFSCNNDTFLFIMNCILIGLFYIVSISFHGA